MPRRFGRHRGGLARKIVEFVKRYKVQCAIAAAVLCAVVVIALIAVQTTRQQNYEESFLMTEDVIKIGIRTDIPGFGEVDESGEITGFSREVIDELLSRLVEEPKIYEYKSLTSQDAGSAIKYGDAQICIGQLTAGTTQTSGFQLTDSYYTDPVVAMVADTSRLERVSDLESGLGILATSLSTETATEQLEAQGVSLPLTAYSDYESALTDLSHSRINAVLMPYSVARQLQTLGYRVLAEPVYDISYVIMLPSGQTAVAREMNRVLTQMKEDGTLQALQARWNI